ncbi:hypothetical protein PGRAN_00925 [Listeria grandensis FSL F6-0971]|uniref:Uncharacterized protein n=1 Tax=Listeria grandensis FSL F6-0971 TaxID=1265819 RepID=W7BBD3_9LIST|nr:hypothetical protein PGRAN_00925 [Listeria grandensis FSL F6-0971]
MERQTKKLKRCVFYYIKKILYENARSFFRAELKKKAKKLLKNVLCAFITIFLGVDYRYAL